jgi:hypothetical protein
MANARVYVRIHSVERNSETPGRVLANEATKDQQQH